MLTQVTFFKFSLECILFALFKIDNEISELFSFITLYVTFDNYLYLSKKLLMFHYVDLIYGAPYQHQ
jgi:hypothetical protein